VAKVHIAVIGAGPTALITVLELQKLGFNVTIIAPPQKNYKRNYQISNLTKIVKKDRISKNFIYSKFSKNLEVKQSKTNFLETPAIGGLSNIWGGICFPQSKKEDKLTYITSREKKQITSYLVKFLNITNTNSQLWKFLEHSHSSKRIIKDSPSVAVLEGNVWNAAPLFKKINKSKIIFGEAINISPYNKQLKITILKSDKLHYKVFDRVFVACGPIGDAKLILNSIPDNSQLEIKDSSTEYHLLFRFSKSKKLATLMIPSECVVFLGDQNYIKAYAQIYPISEQLAESIIFWRSNFITNHFCKIINKFFVAAIVFYPEIVSKSFIVKKTIKGFETYTKKENHRIKQKRKLEKLRQKSFRELGYQPTYFKIKNKPGSGIHSGAFLFNGKFDYGRCPGAGAEFKNVHFLGASTLPSIPAGPITFVALINCIYTVRRVVKDLIK
jgi:hypothetical protein